MSVFRGGIRFRCRAIILCSREDSLVTKHLGQGVAVLPSGVLFDIEVAFDRQPEPGVAEHLRIDLLGLLGGHFSGTERTVGDRGTSVAIEQTERSCSRDGTVVPAR